MPTAGRYFVTFHVLDESSGNAVALFVNNAIVPESEAFSIFSTIDGDVILDLPSSAVINLRNQGPATIDLPSDPIIGATLSIIQIE